MSSPTTLRRYGSEKYPRSSRNRPKRTTLISGIGRVSTSRILNDPPALLLRKYLEPSAYRNARSRHSSLQTYHSVCHGTSGVQGESARAARPPPEPEVEEWPLARDRHLGELAMDIQFDTASTCSLPPTNGWHRSTGGQTTPTDPRSRRIRASRRGGQITNTGSKPILQERPARAAFAPECSRSGRSQRTHQPGHQQASRRSRVTTCIHRVLHRI